MITSKSGSAGVGVCRRVRPRNRAARSFITVTSARSSASVASAWSWLNAANSGAPRPSSIPPLGSITHSRTVPARTAGDRAAMIDHNTLPLPDPVAPATRT